MSREHLPPVFAAAIFAACFAYLYSTRAVEAPPTIVMPTVPVAPPVTTPPAEVSPSITPAPAASLTVDETYVLLQKWQAEAPGLVTYGVLGKSGQGRDIGYIRVGKGTGPRVLITACIHGNEKLCGAVSLAVVGQMIDRYLEDPRVTELLRTRDLYYVPIVCPDGFTANTRHEGGLDPNRDWTGPNLAEKSSIPSVAAMKAFFLQHRFAAVMSCHNHGRVLFYPWGYQRGPTEQDVHYRSLTAAMTEASGYRAVQMYHQSVPPYSGYENDWYHKAGAVSVVNEIGRRFEVTNREFEEELRLNMALFRVFIERSPLPR